MSVKISFPSNKSEALVHHMGNIGLANREPWQSRKSPAVALSRHFDMVLRVDATSISICDPESLYCIIVRRTVRVGGSNASDRFCNRHDTHDSFGGIARSESRLGHHARETGQHRRA